MPMSRFALVSLAAIAAATSAASCREVSCPDGEVAVEGRCYPREAVDAVGGGVPVLCDTPCSGATPHCDYRTGTCFSCRDDSDCTDDAAAACDPETRTCTGCAEDADCHRFGLVCETESQACVECTLATEASACDGNSCDLREFHCTATPVGLTDTCDECASDSECRPGMRCVAYQWRPSAPVETVCLWDSTEVPCATSRSSLIAPYHKPLKLTTVSGELADVCGPPSTCYATRAYLRKRPCSTDSPCSNTLASGVCMGTVDPTQPRCAMWCADGDGTAGYVDFCTGNDECSAGFCRYAPQ